MSDQLTVIAEETAEGKRVVVTFMTFPPTSQDVEEERGY